MEVGNITKATFKKFSSPKLLKHTITVLFDIFMRQTLTDFLGGYTKI